jgi:adenylate cyclase
MKEMSTETKIKPVESKQIQFSIRYKLLLIVSFIIILGLSTMIYLVTFFYKSNSEVLIQEYNLSLARLASIQVESNLKNTSYRMQAFHASLQQKNISEKELQEKANQFFLKNPHFIFIGIAKKNESDFKFLYEFTQEKILTENKIEKSLMPIIHEITKEDILRGFNGSVSVVNASSKFNFPVLALIVPSEINPEEVLLLYLEPTEIIGTFQSALQTDIFEVFMVNQKGEVIAHSDDSQTISKGNKSEIPIVKKMLGSNVDNGSQKYMVDQKEYLGSFRLLDFSGLGIVSTVESDKVFEAIYQIQRRNIVITIIILTISFIIVYLFANTLTVPLTNLVLASRYIEEGIYKVEIKPTTRDEVGLLTQSFLQMAKGLQERENIKNTFGKFVNRDIAEKALHGELQLGGVKRNCAIFFSDLRNFTGMSEKMEAEQVVEFLNQYFTEMVECIYNTNGIVDKFIGDAIMAHWGALYTDGNDTGNAIDAALLMRQALINFNRDIEHSNRPKFRFGCGINTGEVVAGQIGSPKKLEYTVIGDAVNLASRIEYMNKEFGTDILISEDSYNKVVGKYKVVAMPPIEIRGKSKPQLMYAVLGKEDDPTCPKSLIELRQIVGIPFQEKL